MYDCLKKFRSERNIKDRLFKDSKISIVSLLRYKDVVELISIMQIPMVCSFSSQRRSKSFVAFPTGRATRTRREISGTTRLLAKIQRSRSKHESILDLAFRETSYKSISTPGDMRHEFEKSRETVRDTGEKSGDLICAVETSPRKEKPTEGPTFGTPVKGGLNRALNSDAN